MQSGTTAFFIVGTLFLIFTLIREYRRRRKPPLVKHAASEIDPMLHQALPIVKTIANLLQPLCHKIPLWVNSEWEANPIFIIAAAYDRNVANAGSVFLDFCTPHYLNRTLLYKWWNIALFRERRKEFRTALSAYNKRQYDMSIQTLLLQIEGIFGDYPADNNIFDSIFTTFLSNPPNFYLNGLVFLITDTVYYMTSISGNRREWRNRSLRYATHKYQYLKEEQALLNWFLPMIKTVTDTLKILDYDIELEGPSIEAIRKLVGRIQEGDPRPHIWLLVYSSPLFFEAERTAAWWQSRYFAPLEKEIKGMLKKDLKNLRKTKYEVSMPRLLMQVQEVVKHYFTDHPSMDRKIGRSVEKLLDLFFAHPMNVYTWGLLLLLLDIIYNSFEPEV
ncbi:MAG: hypothetical protein HWN66_12330 [Candidatus Helarchaeota archaeon]|nr:hypothetical protein [Candidatus Helarchaeota archaeon]